MTDKPTIKPAAHFDAGVAAAAAAELRQAMRGFGTDEDKIISCLIRYSCEQRQKISDAYKQSYGRNLADDLRSELGGNFEDLVIAMITPPRIYDARQLKGAMKGAGTDESTLIEILCSRSNAEIAQIKAEYAKEFGSLEEDLEGDTSGNFCRMMVSLSTGSREEGKAVDLKRANDDATALHEAGEGAWGTDETEFNRILCRNSFSQLQATFKQYEGIRGTTIEEAIESETSGSLKEGYLSIVKVLKNRYKFFAERLNQAIAGAGTDDNDLIRIIVSRSEIDLGNIKKAYEDLYGQPLADAVEGDTGGDYKKLLLALVHGN